VQSSSLPAKNPAGIAGMFDAIAGRYDLLNHLLSGGLDKRWRKQAIDALHLSGRETVLDLCTGTADLAIAAMDAAQPAQRVVGIDFSSAMLKVAKTKIRGAIALVRGDATRIPLCDASVDAVTIGFGIRNVEQPAVACREIVRVLKAGGRLVILEFSLPRSAMLRNLYLWYFRRILPLVGRAISKHPSAYTYLPESVEAFPSPDQFARQLRATGCSSVKVVPLTFGIVYMFVAVKK
jgi:demethylmenaquinone methyltransferase/2-methoxy-6-polyprenyl-1,4-benzoquinol methylase